MLFDARDSKEIYYHVSILTVIGKIFEKYATKYPSQLNNGLISFEISIWFFNCKIKCTWV